MSRLRTLSPVERLWLIGERLAPPFANQIVFEASASTPLSVDRLREGLIALEPSFPLLRSQRVGVLGGTRWNLGKVGAALRVVDGGAWDGLSDLGAPFLCTPPGPPPHAPVELLVVQGEPTRLILRTRHAATDGRGTQLLAEALFSCLRGEEQEPCLAGPVTDLEVAKRAGRQAEQRPQRDQVALLPHVAAAPGPSSPAGMTWIRCTLPQAVRSPMTSLLSLLASRAGHPIRIDVPVDMRRHVPTLRSTANLTGLLRVEVRPGDSPSDVRRQVQERLARSEETDFVLGTAGLRHVPLWLMTGVARRSLRESQVSGLFETAGTVSNLGLLDPSRFSYDEFPCERVFFIPPGSPGLPLFATLTGGPAGVELVVAVPRWLLGDSDLGFEVRQMANELVAAQVGLS